MSITKNKNHKRYIKSLKLRKTRNKIKKLVKSKRMKKKNWHRKGGNVDIVIKKSTLDDTTVGKIVVGNSFPFKIDERLSEIVKSLDGKKEENFEKNIKIQKLDE